MDDKTRNRIFHWPILVAAVVFLFGAAYMANDDVGKDALSASLVAIAATLLGAWLALLARSGYTGGED